MTNTNALVCDGCGQAASAEHTARRLRRLEWTTRYRPVHIQALLLGAVSPQEEKEFLYAPNGEFEGEAARVLEAAGISPTGKTREAVHAEFQRAGFFLTYVLECPLDDDRKEEAAVTALMRERLAAVATRIRRSLKPKRLMVIAEGLAPIADRIVALELGCPVVLDAGRPFDIEGSGSPNAMGRLREALAGNRKD